MMYVDTDTRGQQKLRIAQSLVPNTPALPVGEYSLIVADPPWRYHLRETDRSHRGRCPYPSMNDDQIKAMPVQVVAAENAYLLLWTTNNHLPLAFEVATAWGFEYKALHTWLKMTLAGDKIRFGIGHYGRNCTEHFLVCRKGKAPSFTALGLTDVPTAFQAPPQGHSEKPDVFYRMAERLGSALGGQKLELFARNNRPGWRSWGAEAERSPQ